MSEASLSETSIWLAGDKRAANEVDRVEDENKVPQGNHKRMPKNLHLRRMLRDVARKQASEWTTSTCDSLEGGPASLTWHCQLDSPSPCNGRCSGDYAMLRLRFYFGRFPHRIDICLLFRRLPPSSSKPGP